MQEPLHARGYLFGQKILAWDIPQKASDLNKALFDIVSSGFVKSADAADILRVAARTATAGLTDVASSASVLITALNAYGFAADKATDVSRILFEAQRFGRLTFKELAVNLGKTAQSAAVAGIPLRELAAAFVTVTLSGILFSRLKACSFTAFNFGVGL